MLHASSLQVAILALVLAIFAVPSLGRVFLFDDGQPEFGGKKKVNVK